MARIIVLKFQSLTDPVLVKKVSIPSHNPKLFDVDILKQMLLKEMLEDDTIKLLGGNESTTVNDISILKYDEEIEEVVDVLRSEVFCRIEKNVLVKLRKTDTTTSVIVHNGTDDEIVEGRTRLKKRKTSLDVNSSPVTSDRSEVDYEVSPLHILAESADVEEDCTSSSVNTGKIFIS